MILVKSSRGKREVAFDANKHSVVAGILYQLPDQKVIGKVLSTRTVEECPMCGALKSLNDSCPRGCVPPADKPRCPKCGSTNLKDRNSLLIEGTSCEDCGWCVMDAGAALA